MMPSPVRLEPQMTVPPMVFARNRGRRTIDRLRNDVSRSVEKTGICRWTNTSQSKRIILIVFRLARPMSASFANDVDLLPVLDGIHTDPRFDGKRISGSEIQRAGVTMLT